MQSSQSHGLPPGANGDPRGSSPGEPGRGVATLSDWRVRCVQRAQRRAGYVASMDKRCTAARKRSAVFDCPDDLWSAYCALDREYREDVELCRDAGVLLHFGCVQ